MNTPAEIVTKINRSGGSLTARDGELVLKAPPGTLDADDLALLREHKQTIVKILSEEPVRLKVTANGDGIDVHCPDEETAQRIEQGRERVEQTIQAISNEINNGSTRSPAAVGSINQAGTRERNAMTPEQLAALHDFFLDVIKCRMAWAGEIGEVPETFERHDDLVKFVKLTDELCEYFTIHFTPPTDAS